MRPWLLCIFSSILVSGCYTPRYVYSPSAHNVPLLTKKGDSKIAVNYSTNLGISSRVKDVGLQNRSSGVDLQGAYAFHKKFAVQASYFGRSEKNEGNYSTTLDSATIRYSRSLGEIGLGYYSFLSRNNRLMFQCFGGIGVGRFRFTDEGKDAAQLRYTRFHDSRVFKLYIQPAFQFTSRKRITASLSSRFSIISFNSIETNYSMQEQENFELASLNSAPAVFWEPAVINSFGFKKLPGFFLEYQAGLSLLMSRRFVDARALNFSLGLMADLPVLLKKKAPVTKKG